MGKMRKRGLAFLLCCVFLLESCAGVFAQDLGSSARQSGHPVTGSQSECTTGRMKAEPIEMDLALFSGNRYSAEELSGGQIDDGNPGLPGQNLLKESFAYSDDWDKYSSNYYYNQMNEDEREYWDALDAVCLKYLKKKTDLTTYLGYYVTDYVYSKSLTLDEVMEVAQIFRYSNPQYYFLEPLMFYANTGYRAGVAFLVYDAFGKGSRRAKATKNLQDRVESFVTAVNEYTTDYEKVKAAHDIICANTTYNYDVLYTTGEVDAYAEQEALTQSAYSALCMGNTVCAGYAQAFEMVCNGAGIDAAVVTSVNHEWNKVRMNDSWYNVDCTWDDQTNIVYDFFARSDYAYDYLLTNAASHVEESQWDRYLPSCTLDSGSGGSYAGMLPAVSGTTEPVQITVENTYRHDKTADEDYVSGYKVTLTTKTPGADIYYTTDGTFPSPASSRAYRYRGPFTITYAAPLMAIAVCNQQYDSAVTTDESCEAPTYAIHYELNGGENNNGNPSGYKITDKTIKLKKPSRTGYKFGGWYKTKKFNSSKIKQIKSGSAGAICLYAKWTPIKYKVRFDGNGATSGSVSTKKCKYGTNYTMPSNKYKKDGYEFVGWSTKKSGKGTIYGNKEKFTNLSAKSGETVILYAVWKKK